MFSPPTPQQMHEESRSLIVDVRKDVLEANSNIIKVQRQGLQDHANLSSLIGDLAKIVVGSSETTIEHHAAMLATMKAQSANKVIRSINKDGKTFCMLQKEFPSGNENDGGVHLANSLAIDAEEKWQSWPPLATPNVGDYPPTEITPKSLEHISKFTHAQILQLVAFYNDSFGIQTQDSLELRQEKFRRWCSIV